MLKISLSFDEQTIYININGATIQVDHDIEYYKAKFDLTEPGQVKNYSLTPV